MTDMQIRSYTPADQSACLAVFQQNVPDFFAPNEEADFIAFLQQAPKSYRVVTKRADTTILGCFGLTRHQEPTKASINWIMLASQAQGMGVGRLMMQDCLAQARQLKVNDILIAASQHSAPFFAHFGAIELARQADGWGPGMHKVDMLIGSV